MTGIWGGSADWVSLREAPSRVGRSKRTIYQWVADGRVKTMRPGRETWLYLPDLLKLEGTLRAGRPRTMSE